MRAGTPSGGAWLPEAVRIARGRGRARPWRALLAGVLAGVLAGPWSVAGAQWSDGTPRTVVRPRETFAVLNNPGIGFTTFQRFNGDAPFAPSTRGGMGWDEGQPIEFQPFDGRLANPGYPDTRIAYQRLDWAYLEPRPGEYAWPLIDRALQTATERGQTLMLRVMPYQDGDRDVPAWYRGMVGAPKTERSPGWRVDPEDPRFLRHFGAMVRALGQRYDGHPALEQVDIAFVGPWGEGEGTHLLSDRTRIALIDAYLDAFPTTRLSFQPLNGDAPDPAVAVRGTRIAARWPDGSDNGRGPAMRDVGFRMDCIGDVIAPGRPDRTWSHMQDLYPADIVRSGMGQAWKRAPVSMEICWVFDTWLNRFRYDRQTVEDIFRQALKWHVSTFNAKSSPVPDEWRPLVDRWLTRMGYRLVLRRLEFANVARRGDALPLRALVENVGVAPPYRDWRFAARLQGGGHDVVLTAPDDLRRWLPGDHVLMHALPLPAGLPAGRYALSVGVVAPGAVVPGVRLAIEGDDGHGWYPMGQVEVADAR